jgi:hypothetical protein
VPLFQVVAPVEFQVVELPVETFDGIPFQKQLLNNKK